MIDFFLDHSYLPLVFPLLSFVVIGLWLGSAYRQHVARFAIVMSGLSLVSGFGTAVAFGVRVLAHPEVYPDRTLVALKTSWLNFTPHLTADMGIYLDPISVMMLVVITLISFLVTVYSVGYMQGDPGFCRFFSLLHLFSFSMLGLVISTNILQMFVFWELVGVSSYALIGFWYEKPSAVDASKKAFILTRFADAFFLLGIIVVSYYGGSFDFQVLNSPETAEVLQQHFTFGIFSVNLLTLSTLLIFAGGWGKSAMFPLHVWLPDAMEGPTPVSSIIHSATMVVAGVYLTARMFPLFAAAPGTLALVQFVGAFTALFAAVIAITQRDIKRILAFSTLSQLGYMMFALGTAKLATPDHGALINPLGYSASMFHVFTHAFFKCMLFLGAGAVIHAVHSNDIGDMGGLRTRMPKTYWSMLVACLAIGGIFPFSGFWSKDEILLAALQSGHYCTFFLGLLTGGLTAFYMFRLFFLTFHGNPRSELHGVHEDPWMTFSIVALTIPTVLGGLAMGLFGHHVLPPMELPDMHGSHSLWLPFLASLVGLGGIGLAWYMYGESDFSLAAQIRRRLEPVYVTVYNKFYIDELYLYITRQIIFRFVAAPIKWFDRHIVDGTMDLVGLVLQVSGRGVRLVQNGQLQFYLGETVVGLVVLLFLGVL
jgi:NADH-quinone oxidoreductase subunit L